MSRLAKRKSIYVRCAAETYPVWGREREWSAPARECSEAAPRWA